MIVPVPLHGLKQSEREFNQAERLARRLSAATRIPLRARLLKRVELTRTQTQLSRAERAANVRRAFVVRQEAPLQQQNVVVVDDVLIGRDHACKRCCWTPEQAKFVHGRGAVIKLEISQPMYAPTSKSLGWTALNRRRRCHRPLGDSSQNPSSAENPQARHSEGLWTVSGDAIFDKELMKSQSLPKCQHHFTVGARERVHSLVETCSFEMDRT
jgi:hypothetical protein